MAERIQLLGGVSVAMAPDVAAMTRFDAPPSGREVRSGPTYEAAGSA
jgi:starvation-inducible DNA-binding protein